MLDETRAALGRLLLLDRWLSDVDFAGIAWVEQGEILLEAGTLVVCCKGLADVGTASVVSDCLYIVSKDSIKGLAAAFHEPNLEMSILRQRVKERLY